jgi:hypothetical protein
MHAGVPPFYHTPSGTGTYLYLYFLVQENSEHNDTLGTNIAIISEHEVNNCKRKQLKRHDSTSGECAEQYVCNARLRQCTMYHGASCLEGEFKFHPTHTMMACGEWM